VHYNKDMYSADADMFRPRRWLKASGAKLEAITVKSIVIIFNNYPNNYYTSQFKYILLSTAVQYLLYSLFNYLNIYTAVY
jgi:hypothetical protein